MEHDLGAYVSREVMRIFEKEKHALVAVNEALPGRIEIDFHFRDKQGTDVFVEVKARKIERSMLSEILNLYSSISNIEPSPRKFELVLVGFGADASVKRQLKELPVKLLTFKELGITQQKLKQFEEAQRQLRALKLSPEEARLATRWEGEKKTVVRASDVQKALGCTLDYAYFLLHNLERKRWLERIDTGLYQFVPAAYGYPEKIPPANAFVVGAAFVEPYYFSFYTSNSHYGFTTQMPFTLFVATTKKKADVEWQGNTFKFVTLSKRKFFGYKCEKVFDAEVNMADPEKSLVDSFDKPHYAGGIEQLVRIAWRGLPKVDQKKLVDYAVRMQSHTLVQRLGFIVDFLVKEKLVDPLPDYLRTSLLGQVGKTASYLDARKPKRGEFDKDWRIVNNIPKTQLLSEVEIR
jgi:predicted transcriptional regulator of viral defense system